MKMKNYLKATFFLAAIISVWLLKPTEKSQNVDPLLLQNMRRWQVEKNLHMLVVMDQGLWIVLLITTRWK